MKSSRCRAVALLAEGVDRNLPAAVLPPIMPSVALLAEGVDRNNQDNTLADTLIVALLAEGVDRNAAELDIAIAAHKSPSSRRAWIEIVGLALDARDLAVALLAEGVDRNS